MDWNWYIWFCVRRNNVSFIRSGRLNESEEKIVMSEGLQAIHQLNISMKGLSYYIPEGRKTNEKLIEDFLDYAGAGLSFQNRQMIQHSLKRKFQFLEISSRSCIGEGEDESSVCMSVNVAKEAIERANLNVNDIDLLLFAGVTNPLREPSFSNVIAYQLGLDGKDFFDINDTCNGFMKAIDLAGMYIQTGRAKNVLVVTCECPDEILNGVKSNLQIKSTEEADRLMTMFLAGTGAAAIVVGENNGTRVMHSYCEERGSKEWDLSIISVPAIDLPEKKKNFENVIVQSDGMGISSRLIEKMPVFAEAYLKKVGVLHEELKYVFCHQMGRNTTYAVMKKLRLDIESQLQVSAFKQVGNLACANIPVSLGMAMEKNMLCDGDTFLLLGSSCGLNLSAICMTW